MIGLTRQAGAFVATLDPASIPDVCMDAAAAGITDCVGVMIAGADEPAPKMVRALVSPPTGDDTAPLIPGGDLLAPADAALVNGVAGHALDYDDVGIDGHPSTVLAPAILAEGHALGLSGERALAAYVAGFELWALLDALEPGKLHDRGFHPTAVQGTIATAAACAVLRGLDAERAVNAIAIGASLGSGLVANFGTMTKPLHAGRAAQSGIIAARLAAQGFTASGDVLEHRTGYLLAHSPSGSPDVSARDHGLGRDWRMPSLGLNIKRYPLCYSTHRAIDAMLGIVAAHDLAPQDVRQIRVGAGVPELLMLRNHAPRTGLEAKFSMEFAMACALVARGVGIAELSDAFVRRPDVVEIMGKVHCTGIHDGIAGMPDSPPDTVEVELTSGTVLTHPPVQYARGSWQNPLGRSDLMTKFIDCATTQIDERQASDLFDRLCDLRGLTNLRDLDVAAEPLPRRRSA